MTDDDCKDLPEKQVHNAARGEEEDDGGGGPAVGAGDAAEHIDVGFGVP